MSLLGKKKALEDFLRGPIHGNPPTAGGTMKFYVGFHPPGGKRPGAIDDWSGRLVWETDGADEKMEYFIPISENTEKLTELAKASGKEIMVYEVIVKKDELIGYVNDKVGKAMKVKFKEKVL